MKKFTELFFKHWPILLLGFLTGILFVTNYKPGTYLAGWDNLQTELNPALSIKRAFYSAWQEYQSLGLAAGMAHAADLVRSIFIWLISFIIPQSMIRYIFHMLMVFIGGLGILRLLQLCGLTKRLSFIGAVFYIFNFNVVQMMFLPFEPFSIFMAALPWEIWIFIRILTQPIITKRSALLFVGITILSTSQALVQQNFVVLMLLLGLIVFGLVLKSKSIDILKRAALLVITILLINSFWVLPQLYFLKTSASVVKTAKINQLATEDLYYRNKEKGTILDFIKSEGFYYEGLDKNKNFLFEQWRNHRENLLIQSLIFVCVAVTLLGIFTKSPYQFSFILVFGLVAFVSLSNMFPINMLNEFARKNDFINQIFRSPFTKFSIPYALVSTYLFAFGVSKIFQWSKKLVRIRSTRIVNSALPILIVSLILIINFPAFRGYYLSPEMKVKIPDPYFKAMDYFKTTDKNKRIALLPEYTHWGWSFHTWGYNGSGFLWYGIEQPIISRTFDVWSNNSESYFWEAKYALESEDANSFERVLEKYNVDYLLFDTSLTPVVSSAKAIQYDRIKKLLSEGNTIKLEKQWDFLSLYTVKHDKAIKNFVSIADTLPNIGPSMFLTNEDTAYKAQGDYVVDAKRSYDSYYPFLGLTTQSRITNGWRIIENGATWFFTKELPFESTAYKLSTSSGNLDVDLIINDQKVKHIVPYSIHQDNNRIIIEFPKIPIFTYELDDTEIQHCTSNTGRFDATKDKNNLSINNMDGNNLCFSYDENSLEQRYGYIVKLRNKNYEGQRFFFYILDKTKEQPYVETRLTKDTEYFILGSRYNQGLGYSFSFQTNSYKSLSSHNELKELTVFLVPYALLKSLSFIKENVQKPTYLQNFSVEKKQYYLYVVSPEGDQDRSKYIILNQTYQSGWNAYSVKKSSNRIQEVFSELFPFMVGNKLQNHVIVNNWANGWKINNSQLIIIYWPQYLEYIGFAFLLVAIGWVSLRRYE